MIISASNFNIFIIYIITYISFIYANPEIESNNINKIISLETIDSVKGQLITCRKQRELLINNWSLKNNDYKIKYKTDIKYDDIATLYIKNKATLEDTLFINFIKEILPSEVNENKLNILRYKLLYCHFQITYLEESSSYEIYEFFNSLIQKYIIEKRGENINKIKFTKIQLKALAYGKNRIFNKNKFDIKTNAKILISLYLSLGKFFKDLCEEVYALADRHKIFESVLNYKETILDGVALETIEKDLHYKIEVKKVAKNNSWFPMFSWR